MHLFGSRLSPALQILILAALVTPPTAMPEKNLRIEFLQPAPLQVVLIL